MSLVRIHGAIVGALLVAPISFATAVEPTLKIDLKAEHPVQIVRDGAVAIQSPTEGLWSIATDWKDGWPSAWRHVRPEAASTAGEWTILTGSVALSGGTLHLRDAYRVQDGLVQCVRRYEWKGTQPLEKSTLSVRFHVPGADRTGNAAPLFPGISTYGNPSGAKMLKEKRGGAVPIQTMVPGEESLYEEHRYSMPFASLEFVDGGKKRQGVALHSVPSMPSGANHADQWWSLGVTVPTTGGSELTLLSGPCASNGLRSVVKSRQGEFMPYPDTFLNLRPGTVVEKTFWLQTYPVDRKGNGFSVPLRTSLDLFEPFSTEGLPTYRSILDAKLKFAKSRWREREEPGFEMYPATVKGTQYVMGWCGQAEALGYALLALGDRAMPDAEAKPFVQRSLDVLSRSPFNERGFFQRYNPDAKTWTEQDFVSQGQAMESITRAIELARKRGSGSELNPRAWEAFMRKALDFHAARILDPKWRPLSTNEGFLVSPLLRGARLFGEERYQTAGLKAADHYAERHVTMEEPYWGGTLDAQCEDKEGAWAAFQAFLAAYDATGKVQYRDWAEHAMNVALTYTVVWDIDLPAGRLKDHGFKSRGWTVVSAQNQHLDVFGVYYTPEIYRMGQLLGRQDLKELAAVMFRSCGQLIDPFGSQGEQIQQTNFAQHGDMSDVFKMRGGYSEGWTVFWITTHFLHAAGRFEEMGVDLDDPVGAPSVTPSPLFRDPVYDGAADPVCFWNPFRKTWWMIYTQRRANLDLPKVEWCHQTEVGLAESRDEGLTWTYMGTVPLKAPDAKYSFWAPDIVRDDAGTYHMYVSYVPGEHIDWGGERHILHYTSENLSDWQYRDRLPLTSNYCIDASLFRMPNGAWRLWYKDEGNRSATLAVESTDLVNWKKVEDPGVSKLYGEGPKIFLLGGYYWLLKDPDSGLDVYRSSDLNQWTYQGKILEKPGKRVDDGSIGKHADVVVNGNEATIVYFTHPYGQNFPEKDGILPFPARRSSILAARLEVRDGKLVCDRNAPFRIRLGTPK